MHALNTNLSGVGVAQALLPRDPAQQETEVRGDGGRGALRRRLHRFPLVELRQASMVLLDLLFERHFSWLRSAIPSSRRFRSGTGAGASHIRSLPRAVLGNGITSRMEVSPARIITRRSSPRAMPPCGGAPYSSASSSQKKRRWASSSLIPRAAKTLFCTSRR